MPWGTPVSLDDYGTALKKGGTAILPGAPGTIWTRYETAGMVRLPAFCTRQVSQQEARRVLWRGRSGVISFPVEPNAAQPANAWVYVCRDRSYALEKLNKEARRDARRAQRSLRIEPLEWTTLLQNGFTAYSDTRGRIGLSDGSLAEFKHRFGRCSSHPGHYALGAWKGSQLAAFMSLIAVDNWVAIEGCFSANEGRDLCPNNGLGHYVLDYFLVKRGFDTVTYGTSSVQETNQPGLHLYKTRIGFEAKPIHRTFLLHPLLRPLANRITLWSLRTVLRFNVADRLLRKAIGVVGHILSAEEALTQRERPV